MSKAYKLIGSCLEFVYQNNHSLIQEDKFIIQREICNYAQIVFEICKNIFGVNDKLTICSQQRVNFIVNKKNEQEFEAQLPKNSEQRKSI